MCVCVCVCVCLCGWVSGLGEDRDDLLGDGVYRETLEERQCSKVGHENTPPS